MTTLSGGHLSVDFASGAVPALLPFLSREFDLSYTATAALMLVVLVSSSLLQPLFGLWSDRRGAMWLLPGGVALAGVGTGLASVAPSYALVVALFFAAGVGIAAYHPEGASSLEAVDPAVNAMVARDFPGAPRPRRPPKRRWCAAMSCRRCTACRSASRTCRRPRACARPTAARSSATMSPPPTNAWWRRCAPPARSSSARPTRRNSAPARTRATRSMARPAIRSTRRVGRRLLGRLGGGARHRDGADLLRLRHRRLAAQSRPRSPASSASARRRAWSPTSGAGSAGTSCSVAGPMARTVPDLLPAALRHGQRRCARPAGDDGAWPHDAPAGDDFAVPARVDLSRLRVAAPDFGFAPTERASPRCSRQDRAVPPRLRRGPRTPRRTAPAPTRRSRCCAPWSSWPPSREGAQPARRMSGRTCAPMSRKACATRAQDVARAQSLQTALYRRWQAFFRD